MTDYDALLERLDEAKDEREFIATGEVCDDPLAVDAAAIRELRAEVTDAGESSRHYQASRQDMARRMVAAEQRARELEAALRAIAEAKLADALGPHHLALCIGADGPRRPRRRPTGRRSARAVEKDRRMRRTGRGGTARRAVHNGPVANHIDRISLKLNRPVWQLAMHGRK